MYIVIHKLLKQLKGLIIIGKEGRQDLLSSFDIAQIIVGSRLVLAKQDFWGLGAVIVSSFFDQNSNHIINQDSTEIICLGTIHLRRRHALGGEGSKICQICRRIVLKNCRR